VGRRGDPVIADWIEGVVHALLYLAMTIGLGAWLL
jgi:hypothetical protein